MDRNKNGVGWPPKTIRNPSIDMYHFDMQSDADVISVPFLVTQLK